MNRPGESVRTVTAGGGETGGPGGDRRLVLRGRSLEVGRRTLIMGILNVTPDSFYDGGRHNGTGAALEAAARMSKEGADIIDVGGESTRLGAEAVSPEEEWRRIGPVIGSLVDAGMTVSVDTWKSETARKALEAGAHLVNDISGGTLDPDLQRTVASFDAGLVVMHIQGIPGTMQADPSYTDLMGEILDFLSRQARAAVEAGVSPRSLMIDPGIGFGKRPGDNLEILARTSLLKELPYPLLVGASRKSFIGRLTGLPVEERLEGSLGAAVAAALLGADMVRVHDVRETARGLAVTDAVREHLSRGV